MQRHFLTSSRRLHVAGLLAAGLVLGGTVFTAQSAEAPAFNTDMTLADIMEGIVMPSADVLWTSVSVDVSTEGEKVTEPQTDEDWTRLRHAAVTLAASTNLLVVPGLKIDTLADSTESAQGELSPVAIAKLRNDNLAAWAARTEVLHQTALQAIKAIDDHNAEALNDVGGELDAACESCHLQFWYPEG